RRPIRSIPAASGNAGMRTARSKRSTEPLGRLQMISMSDELKQSIGKALGRIPSGVFVLTAQHAGAKAAMLASWVQQAAFDPPALSVALAKGRPIADFIRGSRKFALSIVPQDDSSLMRRYARALAPDAD